MEGLGRPRTGDTGRAGKQLLAVVDEDGMITLLPPDWTRNTVVGTILRRHEGGWRSARPRPPTHLNPALLVFVASRPKQMGCSNRPSGRGT